MIHWGIIGTGNIAHAFKEALSVISDAKLHAVASRSMDKAKEFVDGNPTIKTYGSYQDLIEDQELDVVYIATPHPFHKENVKRCLEAKKAVLCEKPLTLNARDAKELAVIAKENQVFIMEAMWTKFLPVIHKVQEWIEAIGDIKMIKADFGFNSEFDPHNRIFNKELGGGGLLDVGIYPITFSTMFLGLNPKSIKSEAFIGETGVDEQAGFIFKYDGGKLALLSCAITTNTINTAFIYGSKGRITIPNFWMATEAYLELDDGKNEKYTKPFMKNGYEYEIQEVHQCLKIKQLNSLINPMSDTIKILEIMDEIRQQWNLKYPMEKTE